jgi:UDP-N-acetylmuramate--alanine ligase
MRYFFCGCAGSGMSSLAQYLVQTGHEVFGSDRSFDLGKNKNLQSKLALLGIRIFPQDGSGVESDIDFFVVSSAVEETVPDVQKAVEFSLPIIKRAELLAQILRSQNGIAVGGTSGKTTTTAMVGHILFEAGLKPTILNGGVMINTYTNDKTPSNVVVGDGAFCVVEADESDGSIELYTPCVAVVTNISLDHKPVQELLPLFKEFVAHAGVGAVLNLDSPYTAKMMKLNDMVSTFSGSGNSSATLWASDIVCLKDETYFKLNGLYDVTLNTSGRHNVENALAAMAAAELFGIDYATSIKALSSFKGVKRRLEKLGEANGVTVYDDFAHNPDKIKATLDTLHQQEGKLWIIFQPHGFSPTRLMREGYVEVFSSCLKEDDTLLMPEIFYEGGSVNADISAADLIRDIRAKDSLKKPKAFFNKQRDELIPPLVKKAGAGDRIVVMGARDNSLTDFALKILEQLKKKGK